MTIIKHNPAVSPDRDPARSAEVPHAGAAVRAAVYLTETAARFFRASRESVVAFFGPLEVTTIDRDGARVCHCAEGVHPKDEACLFDGVAI